MEKTEVIKQDSKLIKESLEDLKDSEFIKNAFIEAVSEKAIAELVAEYTDNFLPKPELIERAKTMQAKQIAKLINTWERNFKIIIKEANKSSKRNIEKMYEAEEGCKQLHGSSNLGTVFAFLDQKYKLWAQLRTILIRESLRSKLPEGERVLEELNNVYAVAKHKPETELSEENLYNAYKRELELTREINKLSFKYQCYNNSLNNHVGYYKYITDRQDKYKSKPQTKSVQNALKNLDEMYAIHVKTMANRDESKARFDEISSKLRDLINEYESLPEIPKKYLKYFKALYNNELLAKEKNTQKITPESEPEKTLEQEREL